MTFVAKSISKAELYNENFNHYFTEKLISMTPEHKLLLPNDLDFKIFKMGPAASAEKLNLNEKLWILEVVFGLDVVISVFDPENGLTAKDFEKATKAQKGKVSNGELLETLKIKSGFFLGGRELMASLLYMAHVSTTGIYALVKRTIKSANHKKNERFVEEKKAFNKTLQFLKHYEANKWRIASDYGLNMSEWFCLVNFAIKEGFAIDFYNRDFIYAYNSNKIALHKAINTVHRRGYLIKRKSGKKDTYYISAKGMDMLNRIFDNILLKF
jgi:hypothetical protein